MKNLLVRTLSGAVYVSLIIGSLLIDKTLFALVILVFNAIAFYEFQKFGIQNKLKVLWNVFLSIVVFVLSHFIISGDLEQKWLSILILVPLFQLGIELFNKKGKIFETLSFSIVSVLYITLPLILLNWINYSSQGNFSRLVLAVFVLVWANDSFAYLSGLAFGKHKLFERITPKKTWEGFVGGLLATLIIARLLFSFTELNSVPEWEILALLIALASVFGDFVESMFKRSAGVKDSGNIMPGHGGILDRIDSLLFVFPVVFIYFTLVF
ncbi:MAG: phosphatidate cytidylyltransferase [Bacteroidales bacterium]|nr:phosphatidate cytidylyltransferase [Bacteroidales bacterium]MBN2818219.1 phosphatidate cytidylyltransferase [Bacteroidales bacterium]